MVNFKILQIFIITTTLVQQNYASSGEVMGCGGFVKSNKNNIDLSRIQISLYEKRNNIQRYNRYLKQYLYKYIVYKGFFQKIILYTYNSKSRKVDSTDCAPNNGYFFLPLSPDDKGVFLLKVQHSYIQLFYYFKNSFLIYIFFIIYPRHSHREDGKLNLRNLK